MRSSIVSIVLAGGALALGACSAAADPEIITLAERAEQCRGAAELVATGRNTGDPRQDYRCVSPHDQRAARESRPGGPAAHANAAVDRSLRRGY